jgi:peptidoglycan DL-endopeptidase CwlO
MRTLLLVVSASAAVGAALPSAGSAENAAEIERRADALRAENDALAAGSQAALASLTSLDSRLAQARAELASFRARAAQVADRRRAVVEQLGVVRGSLRSSRNALAERLRTLYEQGETDTLAILLGSGSLSAALEAIETVELAAKQDEQLIAKSRSASRRLASLRRVLTDRQRELDQLSAARAAAAASLAAARSERLSTIAALRATRGSNTMRIAALQEQARTLASVQSSAPPSVPGAPSLPPGPAAGAVRSLVVTATGYALPGHTSSGNRASWGSVAVDPAVIRLGSRLSIPGYGLGVASDTGGAIHGARIDLWFPTLTQARAWGTRAVTITVYPS